MNMRYGKLGFIAIAGLIVAAGAILAASPALAIPITYTMTDTGTGSLNGSPFTDASILFKMINDTTNITGGPSLELLTPDQHIATLDKGAELDMELIIKRGRGYVPAERGEEEEPIGTIRIDAIYSPIKKVNFTVTNARVGQRTDYDRLAMEVWTDGSIGPRDGITYASRVIRDQMSIFAGVEEEVEVPAAVEGTEARPTLDELLYRPVEGLPISVRAFNGLQNADIKYIGELVQRTEQDMLKIKNFGRKSLNEIKEVLGDMSLGLGMRLENLPPRNELDRMWEEQERRESA